MLSTNEINDNIGDISLILQILEQHASKGKDYYHLKTSEERNEYEKAYGDFHSKPSVTTLRRLIAEVADLLSVSLLAQNLDEAIQVYRAALEFTTPDQILLAVVTRYSMRHVWCARGCIGNRETKKNVHQLFLETND